MATLYDNFERVKNYIVQTKPDLSTYATKSYVADYVSDCGYITSIPSEYITQAELSANGYLTSVPSNYVTTTILSNQSYVTTTALNTRLSNAGYITMGDVAACGYISSIPSEYVTDSELSSKGYLTAVPDTYATKSYVADYVSTYGGGGTPDLSAYVTKTELSGMSYATTSQLTGNILPSGSSTYLGNGLYPYYSISSQQFIVGTANGSNAGTGTISYNARGINVSQNIVPSTSNTKNLGSSTYWFGYTYTKNLILNGSNIKDTINAMFSYDTTTGTLTITTL